MLISVKDRNNKLFVKDILAISFDMSVECDEQGFFVKLNSAYRLAEYYSSQDEAEEKMLALASERNREEEELKNY